jgi:2-polyprenyl-6-methoxyphenol hydroxylase-like FAD-dependent oxidoreductase
MKIRIVGGGPAGLLFAYLMQRERIANGGAPHDIRIFERDAEDATYGWGVVFSDVALAFVRDIAPEVYDAITRTQEVFDEMAVVHRGVRVTLAHNTFHRMARIDLLRALHAQCRRVGVEIAFGRRIDDPAELGRCDLIVAADGAHSAIRTRLRAHFQPMLDERPNWLAWYGTSRLFDALSLIFRQNDDGLVIAHAYRYSPQLSTFLVECDPATFERARLARMTEAESLAYCERAFADDLDGHPLLSNRSSWFRYTMVRNARWYHRFDDTSVVLIGDALRTGHPSVGSGTRLALQDSIALFEAHRTCGDDVPALLAEFVRIREPGSENLRRAAQKSTEWYEDLGPKLALDPVSFAYDYVTRSGRVDHAEVVRRDPALARAYEQLHPDRFAQ